MNLNSSPSPSPFSVNHQINNDHDQHRDTFTLSHQLLSSSSSSSSPSSHIFFNSTHPDHTGYYHGQFYHPLQQEDEIYAYQGGQSYHEIKNEVSNDIKLTQRKKEDQWPAQPDQKNNPVKWMSSKMRLTKKVKIDDQKLQPSSSLETDLSRNSSSYNSNSPIRVCSDCNTTKTPLWRSGPKGPKSLCNACGIRQRKARRAMAAATNRTLVASDNQTPVALKIKMQHRDKTVKNGHYYSSSQLIKNGQKKVGFKDFLINLSNNLSLHYCVFPEDEKDAAILLMALSSGLVHG